MLKIFVTGFVASLAGTLFLIDGAALSPPVDSNNVENHTAVITWNDMKFAVPNIIGSRGKNGVINTSLRWPGGVVIYQLDSRFTTAERTVIQSGITDITSKSCITFKLRTTEPNYVNVIRGDPGSGCWSYVGRIGGAQPLNLQAPTPTNRGTCIISGTVSHEFIHVIGYYHEQMRPDRDSFITIKWENIQSGYASQFDKLSTNIVSTYSVPYDYRSVMQYAANAFSKSSSLPTMVAKVANTVLGGSTMSASDGKKLNNMYAGICPGTRASGSGTRRRLSK